MHYVFELRPVEIQKLLNIKSLSFSQLIRLINISDFLAATPLRSSQFKKTGYRGFGVDEV